MNRHKYLSLSEAATLLDTSVDDVLRWISEDCTLHAVIVGHNGSACEFQREGMQTRVINADGTITDLASNRQTGILRCELAEVERYLQARALVNSAADVAALAPPEGGRIEAPQMAQTDTASRNTNAPTTEADDSSVVDNPNSDAPEPLTTASIAYCFDGLRWSESGWKKPLGDKPKWLSRCVSIPGQRGVRETRWNPVLIGAALVQQGHATPRNVRAKFQTVGLLSPWLDTWKTYEANNLDTP